MIGKKLSSPLKTAVSIFCMGLVLFSFCRSAGADPWQRLQTLYRETSVRRKTAPSQDDPWARLRSVYLPFTEAEETSALIDPASGRKVSRYLNKQLQPFASLIEKASARFHIPREIIGAVIMVESGGNPRARSSTSSASGLMQTIDSTFRQARSALESRDIRIADTPFDARASIMAGSWYLDRMYRLAGDEAGFGKDEFDP